MSLSLRTAMQVKCCCAKYPPLYQCTCADLKRQFVNGVFPTPRLIDMRFNMTSGICPHWGSPDAIHPTHGVNSDTYPWPGCEIETDCSECCMEGGSCMFSNHPWCGLLGLETMLPTHAVSTVLARTYAKWMYANGHPDNVPTCMGDAPGMTENWNREWCGGESCCCPAEGGACFQGDKTGGTFNFVEGYLQSFIDGTHKFRAYWNKDGPISYVPDEDYYGEIFMGGEAGSGEEPDEMSFGSSPKVGYSAREYPPGAIWYDESTDIAQLWVWYIPPSGWSCGDPFGGYTRGIYLDIIGGDDHGRHEFLFSSHQTLASLQTAIESLNSGLHVFRTTLGGTVLQDKIPWVESIPWEGPQINNLGCEDCLQIPSDFPVPSCTPSGYDWPTPVGGLTGEYYKWHLIRDAEDAHMRWPAGSSADASEGRLVMQTKTSSGTWSGGDPIQYPMTADQNHFIKMAIRCFDDEINGRGWQTEIDFGQPNLYPDFNNPIHDNECAVSLEAHDWSLAQNNNRPQRYKIVTKNQGECGTSLFDHGYDRWEGNPYKDFLKTVDMTPGNCSLEPHQELPLTGSSGWSLGAICDMQNCPGCVEPVGDDYLECGWYHQCNYKWFFFQTTAVDVTEWIDYPRLD